jgi:4'-phosphopantetheinyl transferase EntD
MTVDPLLQSAIDALSFPGVVIGHRLISPGDEDALLPEEAPAFASSVVKVRRASGSARIVARQLLKRLGHPECALPRTSGGAPAWPPGVVGSLAHDSRVAVAAVGMGRDIGAIGIDVEPAESLPPELLGFSSPRRPYTRQYIHSTKRSLTITTCKLVFPSAKRSCAIVGSSNCDFASPHTW